MMVMMTTDIVISLIVVVLIWTTTGHYVKIDRQYYQALLSSWIATASLHVEYLTIHGYDCVTSSSSSYLY